MAVVNKIRFVSFNCKGFKERNFQYLNELYSKSDIMFLQETWLYSFQESDIKKVLAGSDCYTVSSMCPDDVGRTGRPFGGVALIWRQSLPIVVTPLHTQSNRLCAAILNIDNVNIIIMSIYMPTNDGSLINQNKFNDVLNEISSILGSYNDYHVLIGGDFNLDLVRDRDSRYSDLLNDFLIKESLVNNDCMFDIKSSDYTYEGPNGIKSTIDHYLFCYNFYSNANNFKVFIEGHNLSDHQPLYIEYQLANCHKSNDEICINENQVFCDWNRATKQDVEMFKLLLDDLLDDLTLSQELLECKNMFCKDHSNEIINYFDMVVECIVLASNIAIPKFTSKNSKKKVLPGWNEYVRYYKDKSILWHKIGQEAGSPLTGHLAEIRKLARKKYHSAIRWIKHNKDKIIRNKVASTLKSRSNRLFWNEISKLNPKSYNETNILDSCVGSDSITNLLKDKYQLLYNEYNEDNSIIYNNICNLISEQCMVDKCHCEHNIRPKDVKDAIKKVKNGKFDPI